MKSYPILFSGPMVRALLDGTKSQTRRIFAPDKMTWSANGRYTTHAKRDGELIETGSGPFKSNSWLHYCPFGKPGDQLWVREAWKAHTTFDHLPPRDIPKSHVWYMADDGYKAESRYRQSMHMPRWASRITLEITKVHVERLQDITESDCIAEGCTKNHNGYYWAGPHAISGRKQMATAKSAYRDLWESINGPGSWDLNPWVWVIEFKRATP